MTKATFIFGSDAVRHYEQTGEIPDPNTFNDTGCLITQKEFPSKGHYDTYVEALEDYDGFNDYRVIQSEEEEEQPQEVGDKINSLLVRFSSELAEKALSDRHNLLPDDLCDDGAYKEEFQDEFNELYDDFYNVLFDMANLISQGE